MDIVIKSANVSDAQQLTTLTLASKSYWGYTPEQMKSWTDDLTITEEYIQIHQVFKLENDHTILGYYSTYESSPDQTKLDNLFILPSHIGKGLGKTLLDHCIQNERQQGYHNPLNLMRTHMQNPFILISDLKPLIKFLHQFRGVFYL